MIEAIIIDDEPKAIQNLHTLINSYCEDIIIVATENSISGGINLINEYQPDLVFLDVEMPGGSGFDVLNSFPERDFEVIFSTAYDQYAFKAIKQQAIDYLLKPIDIDELIEAVDKVHQRVKEKNILSSDAISLKLSKSHTTKKLIPVSNADRVDFINPEDILRLTADSNYTKIFLKNGSTVLASKTLKEFEDLLGTDSFFRVHHAHLINLNYIKKYIKGSGGVIVMEDESLVEVSRRKKIDLLKIFGL